MRPHELGFANTSFPGWIACQITQLLISPLLMRHNQNALAAAIEEVAIWLAASGAAVVADNAVMAMETLDTNAKAITDAIMRIRQS